MDVIPDGGPVGGRVVGPVDLDRGPSLSSNLEHEGYEVGLGMVVLPKTSARPGHVKVAEARRPQTVGRCIEPDYVIDRELGATIGIGREGRRGLGNRHLLGFPVDSSGRGEDESRY